jgi:trans-2,3-dihydro-3-hydroxyanthranilate isomerase
MARKFFQVDVFTDRMFGGNPLAVFPEPGSLDEAIHLQIAREMNLSETTFVYPPEHPEADFRIRIFTPGREIPFAGHPTLGTAHILWETGKIALANDSMVLEMSAGLIKVSKRQRNLFMEQPLPSFGDTVKAVDQVAEALSIDPREIDSRFPLQIVSTGFPALYIPIKNLKAVQNVELNLSVLRTVLQGVDMIYVFSSETLEPRSTVHSRAFAPFIGIPEDPATGSAGGALGAYLVRHKVIENLDPSAIVIEQGFEMNRPSTILVSVGTTGEEIDSIQVGGQAITVLEGNLRI